MEVGRIKGHVEHVRQRDTLCPVPAVDFRKRGLHLTRNGQPTPLEERTVSCASTILMRATSSHAPMVRFSKSRLRASRKLLSTCTLGRVGEERASTVAVSAGELCSSWIGNARDCFKRLLDLCSTAGSVFTSMLCSSRRNTSVFVPGGPMVAAIQQGESRQRSHLGVRRFGTVGGIWFGCLETLTHNRNQLQTAGNQCNPFSAFQSLPFLRVPLMTEAQYVLPLRQLCLRSFATHGGGMPGPFYPRSL